MTPVHLKRGPDMPWPEEKVFYLLSGDGLFLCRNHEFFRSSVPAARPPSELAGHERLLELRYPKVPRRLLEQVIGFFSLVADREGAEAAVLLVWNRESGEVEVVVPPQRSTVSVGWYGQRYPLNVYYDLPSLPPHLVPIGDIHCHVDLPAYASFTDVQDEVHRPGLHIVVGRISKEPPELHIEVTVDGDRFAVEDYGTVLEGYHQRRPEEVPAAWMDQVTVATVTYQASETTSDALTDPAGEDAPEA